MQSIICETEVLIKSDSLFFFFAVIFFYFLQTRKWKLDEGMRKYK